jgi:hypothetical protein
MLGPTKPQPRIGSPAWIRHFGGGAEEPATVVEVLEEGRRLIVQDGVGTRHAFTLRRATAAFILEGAQSSPRLRL